MKSAPPAPPLFVVVPPPPVLDGVVGVGVAEPPVFWDGVTGVDGVAVAPPLLEVEPEEVEPDELVLGAAVVVVSVVTVPDEAEEELPEAAGVPPVGGAVSGGGLVGTL